MTTQLKELPGVAEASVSLKDNTATVYYKPKEFNPDDAVDAFEGGKFGLTVKQEPETTKPSQ